MKLLVDTHTHSISSGHAYSTVQEMAREAKENGILGFALTDHGGAMKGAPFLYHFGNLKAIPEYLYGIRVFKGVEANIIDYDGHIDVPELYLERLELVLASFHDICIEPSTIEDHTRAAIKIMENPYIDVFAHPGNPQFQVDIKKVVSAAKQYGKMIEINNHSFTVRVGCDENCREFARECARQGVKIVTSSDAHISFDVGKFDNVLKLLEEVNMPEELVMNTSLLNFEEYFSIKKKRIKYT
jgi:putative hydrolase